MIIKEIPFIYLLITNGTLGITSSIILNKLGKLHFLDNNDRTLKMIFLSFINFILFWLLLIGGNIWIDNIDLLVIITIIITIIISAIYPFLIPIFLFDKTDEKINKIRNKNGSTSFYSKPVRERVYDINKKTIIFIFDFDNNLISCGYDTGINVSIGEPFEVSLVPFNDKTNINSYEDVIEYISSKEVISRIIINFEYRVKLIFIET